MASEFVAGRPLGFDIVPAHQAEARLVRRLTELAPDSAAMAVESGARTGDGDGDGGSEAPALWLSEGLSNSYLIATPEGRVVINTGMGFEGPVHRAAYDAVTIGPISHVIFTQGHVDHVGGTEAFAEDGTVIVAHEANAACQADDARIATARVRRSVVFWADAIAKAGAAARPSPETAARPATQAVPTPDLTFADQLDLQVGGIRLQLLSVPGGETVDSLVVWLPDHRIALVGNLFSALFGHVPNLVTLRGDRPRDPLRFLESAQRVIDLEPELLLTGHFGPVEGAARVRAELERIRDAMRWLHDTVVERLNRGDDALTMMREIELPDHLALGEGYGTVRWAVRAIVEGYLGWFHFGSTTELYGVPASSVHADLVAAAGGPDPLVDRAQAHLDAGRPLEAIHLLEPVLSVDPSHGGARQAEIDAHRALLDDGGDANLWSAGWLRHRIATAERAMGQHR